MENDGNDSTCSIRVLIADDHTVFVDVLSIALEAFGFVVSCADSFDSASKVLGLQKGQFDVILLDLHMPGMVGARSIAKIVSLCGSSAVLLMSSHIREGIATKALIYGVKGFVLKNKSLSSLKEAIETVTSGQIYLPKGYGHLKAEAHKHREKNTQDLSPDEERILARIFLEMRKQ